MSAHRPALARRAAGICVAAVLGVLVAAPAAPAVLRASSNFIYATDDRPLRGKDAIGLAVNPRNSRHVVAVNADWLNGECEFAVSFNRGRTWRGGDLQVPEGFTPLPCAVGPHLANHMMQSVAFGRGRRVYTTFVSPRTTDASGEEGRSVMVARSRNGGRSFETSIAVIPGGPNADQGPDYTLPTIAVNPGRQDRVLVAAASSEQSHTGTTDEFIATSVSTDSGRTWSPRSNANAAGTNAIEQSQPVFDRRGNAYLTFRERGQGQQPGQFTPEGFVTLASSNDGGLTWTQSRVADVRGYVHPTSEPPFAGGRTFTGSTFPRLAVDRRTNNLYVVYQDGPRPAGGRVRTADHFIHPDIDVYFQRSSDGGATWSNRLRVNDDVPFEVSQTRHPDVNVGPRGRIDVVWHDRRHWYRGCLHTHNPCEEARLGDTYYAFSRNGGTSFTRDRRISDRSTNNDVGYDYRFGTYWAYGPTSVPIGRDRVLVGWMDSRRGNFESDTQDVVFSVVNLRARGAPPARRIRRRADVDLSTALSRFTYPGGGEAVLASTFATRPWTRVVIVNQDAPGAALAASVLARANVGPVLLSPASGLPAAVRSEVSRLNPIGAYVIGNEGALSAQVATDLGAAGVPADQIERIAGANDAGTAAAIATEMDRRNQSQRTAGTPAFDAAVIVNPESTEGTAAAALAAARRLPVLFVNRDSVPQETRDALSSLNIQNTLVVGASVSDAILGELPSPERLRGSGIRAVSRSVVAESRERGLPTNIVYVADARDPMHASLLGAVVGRSSGIELVTARGGRPSVRTLRGLGLREVDRVIRVGN